MQNTDDTIVARATPPGRGGVGIVRLSGPQSKSIALEITRLKTLTPRHAHLTDFYKDEKPLDHGLCLYFPAPNSYTGDCVVELHAHGGPVIIDALIQGCLTLGARLAQSGEFTQRAFLNGKMDLAQAEAVADLIDATSEKAALAAQNSLSGAFSKKVQSINTQVIELRMYVEAAIDFVEEEIDFLGNHEIKERFVNLERLFNQLMNVVSQGVLLNEGKTIAIIGAPNAGKSSLLNLWSGEEAAIVTDEPGTTRDMIHRVVSLDGVAINLLDTAGLRLSESVVEQEGIARAKALAQKADWLLWVMDAQEGENDYVQKCLEPVMHKTLKIYNKIDLTSMPPGIQNDKAYLSVKSGEGFRDFLNWLKVKFDVEVQEGAFMARRRHLDALTRAQTHLNLAKAYISSKQGELLAEELKYASQCLQEITGKFTPDDLLGKIFSSFCVGK